MECIWWAPSPWNNCSESLDVLIGGISDLSKTSISSSKYNPARVYIYVLPDRPWLKRALKLLESFSIECNSYVISNDKQYKNISKKTSISFFLQIFIDNQFIGGYSELSNMSVRGDLLKIIS